MVKVISESEAKVNALNSSLTEDCGRAIALNFEEQQWMTRVVEEDLDPDCIREAKSIRPFIHGHTPPEVLKWLSVKVAHRPFDTCRCSSLSSFELSQVQAYGTER